MCPHEAEQRTRSPFHPQRARTGLPSSAGIMLNGRTMASSRRLVPGPAATCQSRWRASRAAPAQQPVRCSPRCALGLLAAQKTSGLQGRWHEHGAVPLARWLALSGPVWVSARTACTPPCQGFYSAVGGVLGGLVAGPAGGLPGCKVAAERAGPGRSRCPQKQPIGCGLELPGGAGHAAVRLACRAPHPAPRGRTLGRHRRRSLKPVCAFAACPAGRGHPHAQAASRGTLSRPQMLTAATAQPRGAV